MAYEVWILPYGPMATLLTDNGSEFHNQQLLQGLCTTLGITKHFITAQHPQGDGVVERFMRTIKNLLTVQSGDPMINWDSHLQSLVYAYNTSLHSATGEIPCYLWFGRAPNTFHQITSDDLQVVLKDSTVEYRQHIINDLQNAYATVFERLQAAAQASTTYSNDQVMLENWKSGDLVWLLDIQHAAKAKSRKMNNPWNGPFVVAKVNTNKTVEIIYPFEIDPRGRLLVNVDRLRRYIAPITDALLGDKRSTCFPMSLLSRKMQNGLEWFRVRYLSLEPKPDVWLPAEKVPAYLKDSFYRRDLVMTLSALWMPTSDFFSNT